MLASRRNRNSGGDTTSSSGSISTGDDAIINNNNNNNGDIMVTMIKKNFDASPRGTRRSPKNLINNRTFLMIILLCISLTGLFLLESDELRSAKRNLRFALFSPSKSLSLSLSNQELHQTNEDSDYSPYDPNFTLRGQCDTLPLEGGHNFWNAVTGEAVRLHKHSNEICGPKVLVVGAMKCGTNTLGHLLAKHPRVFVNRCPVPRSVNGIETGCNDGAFQGRGDDIWEGHDMSIHKIQKDDWLDSWTHRLPWTDGTRSITIDKSPSYFNVLEFPNITHDVKRLLPNAKIAVAVCNPALRLYSEYNHNMDQRPDGFLDFYRDKGIQVPTDFASFIHLLFHTNQDEVCQRLPHFCERNRIFYLRKGEFSTNLKEWQDAFGSENILVVDMYDNQRDIASKLLSLVGHDVLPPDEYPWEEVSSGTEIDFQSAAANYTGRSSAYQEYPEEIVRLEQYYAKYNVELAEMIGRDFPLEWNRRLSEAFHSPKEETRQQGR